MLNSYRELTVWQKSIDLVIGIYTLTKRFPKEELFGITSQIRRAAVSIPANIAEGYSRKHRLEYMQFLRISFASGAELETHLLIAKRLNLASESSFEKIESLLTEVMKMLNALIATLNTHPKP